jgi:hypothetical protein
MAKGFFLVLLWWHRYEALYLIWLLFEGTNTKLRVFLALLWRQKYEARGIFCVCYGGTDMKILLCSDFSVKGEI